MTAHDSKKHPQHVKHDEAPQPGGVYIGRDGQPHDSYGRPIEGNGDDFAPPTDDEGTVRAADSTARQTPGEKPLDVITPETEALRKETEANAAAASAERAEQLQAEARVRNAAVVVPGNPVADDYGRILGTNSPTLEHHVANSKLNETSAQKNASAAKKGGAADKASQGALAQESSKLAAKGAKKSPSNSSKKSGGKR